MKKSLCILILCLFGLSPAESLKILQPATVFMEKAQSLVNHACHDSKHGEILLQSRNKLNNPSTLKKIEKLSEELANMQKGNEGIEKLIHDNLGAIATGLLEVTSDSQDYKAACLNLEKNLLRHHSLIQMAGGFETADGNTEEHHGDNKDDFATLLSGLVGEEGAHQGYGEESPCNGDFCEPCAACFGDDKKPVTTEQPTTVEGTTTEVAPSEEKEVEEEKTEVNVEEMGEEILVAQPHKGTDCIYGVCGHAGEEKVNVEEKVPEVEEQAEEQAEEKPEEQAEENAEEEFLAPEPEKAEEEKEQPAPEKEEAGAGESAEGEQPTTEQPATEQPTTTGQPTTTTGQPTTTTGQPTTTGGNVVGVPSGQGVGGGTTNVGTATPQTKSSSGLGGILEGLSNLIFGSGDASESDRVDSKEDKPKKVEKHHKDDDDCDDDDKHKHKHKKEEKKHKDDDDCDDDKHKHKKDEKHHRDDHKDRDHHGKKDRKHHDHKDNRDKHDKKGFRH